MLFTLKPLQLNSDPDITGTVLKRRPILRSISNRPLSLLLPINYYDNEKAPFVVWDLQFPFFAGLFPVIPRVSRYFR